MLNIAFMCAYCQQSGKKQALVAPGGKHITITHINNQYRVKLVDSPPVHGVKPAADVLFENVSKVYKSKRILAIILTGMGSDGLASVRELKANCNCCLRREVFNKFLKQINL